MAFGTVGGVFMLKLTESTLKANRKAAKNDAAIRARIHRRK